jgi:hypothetical protein
MTSDMTHRAVQSIAFAPGAICEMPPMLLDDRKAQVLPTPIPIQLPFAVHFASSLARRFTAEEKVFDVRDRHVGIRLVVEGGIIATRELSHAY